jgi:hypothetical protein
VSDEQLPGEDQMSKRERQKARRQQRLEAERAAAQSSKAKKGIATFVVAALVLGLLGYWGFSAFTERRDRNQRIEEANARLGELGCTEVENPQVLPSAHLSGAELASNAPDDLYPDRPTTSGRHLGDVAISGAFDKVVDERLLIHNLEHGYVNIFVHEDVPAEEWQEVSDFAGGLIGGTTEKIIASRWKADMPDGAQFAFTAWGARQLCEQWDQGVAESFIDQYHYLEGTAPERTVQPHRGTGSGGIDPDEEEGDLLFPPLGEPADPDLDEDVMEEPEGNTEEGEEGPRDDEEAADEATDDETEATE